MTLHVRVKKDERSRQRYEQGEVGAWAAGKLTSAPFLMRMGRPSSSGPSDSSLTRMIAQRQ